LFIFAKPNGEPTDDNQLLGLWVLLCDERLWEDAFNDWK
jgi:hypothetical protein